MTLALALMTRSWQQPAPHLTSQSITSALSTSFASLTISFTAAITFCAGSVSIPAVQLPSALQAPAEEFQRQYRCARPASEDLVVVYSRTHTRAAWAAQVAADAGLRNCFVLLQVRSLPGCERVQDHPWCDAGALLPAWVGSMAAQYWGLL